MADKRDVCTLVARMRVGDPDAIGEFVTRYRAPLLHRVRLALLTKRWNNGSFNSHAETIVDSALFRFYARLMRGPLEAEAEDRNLINYILGISRNLCADMSRSNRRRRASESLWLSGRHAADERERRLGDFVEAKNAILESIKAGTVSDDDANLIIAHDYEGKTYVEIARERLGILGNGPINNDLSERIETEANRLRMRAKKARNLLACKLKSWRGAAL